MILPGIRQNVLNNYESYNYNIQLIMHTEEDTKKAINSYPFELTGIIVAETGGSGSFYIDRLEMLSLPTGSTNNISEALSFKLRIIEPMGFSFFDRFFSAANELEWNNQMKFPLFLKLWFSGWDESGVPNPDILGVSYWRVLITNIETNVERSGTTYDIELLPVAKLTNESLFQNVPKSIKFEKKETLEETLTVLGEKLTEVFTEDQQSENAVSAETTYEIMLDDQFLEEDLKIKIEPDEVGDDASNTDGDDRSFIYVEEGEEIENVIERIVLSAEDISEFLIPELKENSEVDPEEQEESVELMRYIAVQTEVEYGDFNEEMSDYNRTMKFTVNRVFRPEIQTPTTEEPDNDDLKRLEEFVKQGLLVKRYDYLFTGDNTEIISFDMNFKTLFFVMLPGYENRATRYPRNTSSDDDAYSNSLPEQRRLTVDVEKDEEPDDEDDKENEKPKDDFSFPVSLLDAGPRYMEDQPLRKSLRDLLSYRISNNNTKKSMERGTNTISSKKKDQDNKVNTHYADAAISSRNMNIDSSALVDMLAIEMEIRGDPYWFGTLEAFNNINDPRENDFLSYANYNNGSIFFLLKFSTPEPFSEKNGLTDNLGRITFSGLYKVMSIINIFENGVFKQKIQAIYNFTTIVDSNSIEKVIGSFEESEEEVKEKEVKKKTKESSEE